MLEWTEFQRCCRQIEALSTALHDGWRVVVEKDELGHSYLEKKIFITRKKQKRTPKEEEPALVLDTIEEGADPECVAVSSREALNCVYNVVYSPSYQVPVLYFNMWRQDGSLLPLDEVWSMVPSTYQEVLRDTWWSTITQQEHPILGTPFFQLHPCKTAHLMKQTLPRGEGKHANYLVTWLSSIAPLVQLTLPNEYSASTT